MSAQQPAVVDVLVEPGPVGVGGLMVTPIWSVVDRPYTSGWVVADAAAADRVVLAINDGRLLANPRVLTDINGQTYVVADEQHLDGIL